MVKDTPEDDRVLAATRRNAAKAVRERRGGWVRLKLAVKRLYFSSRPDAVRFRFALLAFDVITILFFIVSSFFDHGAWVYWVDAGIGAVLALDYLARLWLVRHKLSGMLRPSALADLVVIVSLFLAAFVENLAFLRVLRALRLLRSYHVLRELRGHSVFVRNNERILVAAVNLGVFIFLLTAVVFVQQHKINPQIANYVDALYFTVTTLTPAGSSDVAAVGEGGRLLTVLLKLLGISLFLHLAQAIFQSDKGDKADKADLAALPPALPPVALHGAAEDDAEGDQSRRPSSS